MAGGVLSTLAVTAGAAPSSANGGQAAEPAEKTAQRTAERTALAGQPTASADRSAQSVQASAVQFEREAAQQAAADKAAEIAEEKQQKAEEAEARKAAAKEAAEERASRSSERTTLDVSAASGNVGELVGFLRAQVGKSYVSGGTGPSSYDCSGLVQAAFRQVGVDLPRVSQDQSAAGTTVSTSQAQPGDILYWGGAGSAYHVAVYIGNGQYIDAANSEKGVVVQNVSDWPPDGATRVL